MDFVHGSFAALDVGMTPIRLPSDAHRVLGQRRLNFNRDLTLILTPLLVRTVNTILLGLSLGRRSHATANTRPGDDGGISKAVLPGLPDANDINAYRIPFGWV